MFERFTGPARQVVVLAQEEARAFGHGYIGTEHILLGLLSEGAGIAAQALAALEISLDAAREQVAEITGTGTGQPAGHIPFTPRTKKVLELSLREAQRLGDSYIGTEHILLGLAREGEGVGARVLGRLGASTDRILAQVPVTARDAPGEELRRVAAVPPVIRRGPSWAPVSNREVLARLDEIAGRLAAIENVLTEMRGSPPGPVPGAGGTPAGGTPAGGTPAGGARGGPAAGGEAAGAPEPPAAQG